METDQGKANDAVVDYEVSHQLPPLRGKSTKHNQYGRYCRYRYLTQSGAVYAALNAADQSSLVSWLKAVKVNTNPSFWINRDKSVLALDWQLQTPTGWVLADQQQARQKRKSARRRPIIVETPPKQSTWRPKKAGAASWKLKMSNAARSCGLA